MWNVLKSFECNCYVFAAKYSNRSAQTSCYTVGTSKCLITSLIVLRGGANFAHNCTNPPHGLWVSRKFISVSFIAIYIYTGEKARTLLRATRCNCNFNGYSDFVARKRERRKDIGESVLRSAFTSVARKRYIRNVSLATSYALRRNTRRAVIHSRSSSLIKLLFTTFFLNRCSS